MPSKHLQTLWKQCVCEDALFSVFCYSIMDTLHIANLWMLFFYVISYNFLFHSAVQLIICFLRFRLAYAFARTFFVAFALKANGL